jgi:hypothetical protein
MIYEYGDPWWHNIDKREQKNSDKNLSQSLFDKLYYGLYKDLDIVRVIDAASFGWLGHLVRMEENSPCKKINF